MAAAIHTIAAACLVNDTENVLRPGVSAAQATCTSTCSEAIASALGTAECCADGALSLIALHAASDEEKTSFEGTNIPAYVSRIMGKCSSLTTANFPTTCQGSTPSTIQIRLTNIKTGFVQGTNEAALKRHVCNDVTNQVGARRDQCTVSSVVVSGTDVTFTLSLRLESDAASTAAAAFAAQAATDGTLDLHESENFLNRNGETALADPTKPAGGSASEGDDFPFEEYDDDEADDEGGDDGDDEGEDDGDDDGTTRGAKAALIGIAIGIPSLLLVAAAA